MASFYVRENEIVKDRQGKRWLKFGLWIKLTNLEGAKSAIPSQSTTSKRESLPEPFNIFSADRLTTTEFYLNLSPEDAIREFLNKW